MTEASGSADPGSQGTVESMWRANAHAAILVLDPDGLITAANAEAALWLGLPAEPSLSDLPDPLRHLAAEVKNHGAAVVNRTIMLPSASREYTQAAISVAESVTAPGGLIITIQPSNVHAEYNVRRLDRLASVGTLSASIAHEIKNALVAVRTFVELLLEKDPDTELAGIVRREIGRVDSIVTQLLRFSAPAQPKFANVNLHKLLDHSMRLIQHGYRNKALTVETELTAGSDLVCGDDHQLEQAFVNLLFNAVEAISTTGTISVRTDLVRANDGTQLREGPDQSWLRVRIADTGAGIAPEKMPHIFEPFFTTKQHGTGLGLSVTRKIIHEHRGDITVESVSGKGTTFTVLLPAGAQPR